MSPTRRSPGGFTFDPRSQRYRDPRGRFVPKARVRHALDLALRNAEREIKRLGDQLRRREITLSAWRREMRARMKDVHIFSAAAAKGGVAQLTPGDYGRLGATMRQQYKYLERFAKQIQRGLPLDGRFNRRVELYAQAGRASFETQQQQAMREAGYTECRSVLHPADHCDECIEEAAKGWGPIGHVKPVGTRQCLSRCHCSLEFRKAS